MGKWLGSLLLICLLAISQIASAELNSFQAKPMFEEDQRGDFQLYDGLAIFDDQGLYIHVNEKNEIETVKVESFLILSPGALDSKAILKNKKLKDQNVFAVKIVQEIKFKDNGVRILRYTFFDGAGKVLDEVSFDDKSRWQPIYVSYSEGYSPYFQELDIRIQKSLEEKNRDSFLRY